MQLVAGTLVDSVKDNVKETKRVVQLFFRLHKFSFLSLRPRRSTIKIIKEKKGTKPQRKKTLSIPKLLKGKHKHGVKKRVGRYMNFFVIKH